jgi:hypothetical protein
MLAECCVECAPGKSVIYDQGIKKRMTEGEEERRMQEENDRGEQGRGVE